MNSEFYMHYILVLGTILSLFMSVIEMTIINCLIIYIIMINYIIIKL